MELCLEISALRLEGTLFHWSNSVENVEREIGLQFEKSGVLDWESHSKDWIYE